LRQQSECQGGAEGSQWRRGAVIGAEICPFIAVNGEDVVTDLSMTLFAHLLQGFSIGLDDDFPSGDIGVETWRNGVFHSFLLLQGNNSQHSPGCGSAADYQQRWLTTASGADLIS
jgi:hypothetical protein